MAKKWITVSVGESRLAEANRFDAADGTTVHELFRQLIDALAATDEAGGDAAGIMVENAIERAADFHKRPLGWRQKLYRR